MHGVVFFGGRGVSGSEKDKPCCKTDENVMSFLEEKLRDVIP